MMIWRGEALWRGKCDRLSGGVADIHAEFLRLMALSVSFIANEQRERLHVKMLPFICCNSVVGEGPKI